eukprot:COSAG01_NODE_144_length_24108_cov_11.490441_7_plen_56_part_00
MCPVCTIYSTSAPKTAVAPATAVDALPYDGREFEDTEPSTIRKVTCLPLCSGELR